MKQVSKKEAKLCYILYTISSVLFLLSGIANLIDKGINNWLGITNVALSITFGSLAYLYCKKYKSDN